MKSLKKFWQNNKGLIVFISLMLVFRSAVADWNDVPTGSMKPTIVEGDRVLIDKLAYDIRIPFTMVSLKKLEDPQVNDIVIFESNVAGKRLIKRVIGVPGDTVSLSNNKLTVNGLPLQYDTINTSQSKTILTESNSNGSYTLQLTESNSTYGNFNAVKVPENHYLVLGDNRNNSADSRVIGFVPRSEIIGKSSRVAFSLNYENYYLPRLERIGLVIH